MPPNNPTQPRYPTPNVFSKILPPPLIWSELGRGSWAGVVGSLVSAHRGSAPFRWGGKE